MRELKDTEHELVTILIGLSIRPGTHLGGESLEHLLPFLRGYAESQRMRGLRTIFDNRLFSDFDEWLGTEKALAGSDWTLKIAGLDSSPDNVRLLFRFLREFLRYSEIKVDEQLAEDWYMGKIDAVELESRRKAHSPD